MIDLLTLSIAIGLVVSLIFAEKVGRAAGGLIVPGYLAFHITQPVDVALTFAAAVLTYAVVYALSTVLIVFGKRRTVLMILIGFAFGALLRWGAGLAVSTSGIAAGAPAIADFTVIGYVIPGLIAIWCDRQGLLDTCCATLTAAVVVRLVLVLAAAAELQRYELDRRPIPAPEVQVRSDPIHRVHARRSRDDRMNAVTTNRNQPS